MIMHLHLIIVVVLTEGPPAGKEYGMVTVNKEIKCTNKEDISERGYVIVQDSKRSLSFHCQMGTQE